MFQWKKHFAQNTPIRKCPCYNYLLIQILVYGQSVDFNFIFKLSHEHSYIHNSQQMLNLESEMEMMSVWREQISNVISVGSETLDVESELSWTQNPDWPCFSADMWDSSEAWGSTPAQRGQDWSHNEHNTNPLFIRLYLYWKHMKETLHTNLLNNSVTAIN